MVQVGKTANNYYLYGCSLKLLVLTRLNPRASTKTMCIKFRFGALFYSINFFLLKYFEISSRVLTLLTQSRRNSVCSQYAHSAPKGGNYQKHLTVIETLLQWYRRHVNKDFLNCLQSSYIYYKCKIMKRPLNIVSALLFSLIHLFQ